jgi:hypothetical protein
LLVGPSHYRHTDALCPGLLVFFLRLHIPDRLLRIADGNFSSENSLKN